MPCNDAGGGGGERRLRLFKRPLGGSVQWRAQDRLVCCRDGGLCGKSTEEEGCARIVSALPRQGGGLFGVFGRAGAGKKMFGGEEWVQCWGMGGTTVRILLCWWVCG